MTFFDHPNLLEAFEEYVRVQDALLPDEEALASITFSERFQERMRRMIRRHRYGYYVLFGTAARRAASIIVALLVAFTVATVSVEALREKVTEFFVQVYEKYTQIFFVDDTPALSTEINIEPQKPAYIPEGYELVEEELTEVTYRAIYANDSGDKFCIEQRLSGMSAGTNTEGSRIQDVFVNGQRGVVYQNKGVTTILFAEDMYNYVLSGTCSMEELIKIAELII